MTTTRNGWIDRNVLNKKKTLPARFVILFLASAGGSCPAGTSRVLMDGTRMSGRSG